MSEVDEPLLGHDTELAILCPKGEFVRLSKDGRRRKNLPFIVATILTVLFTALLVLLVSWQNIVEGFRWSSVKFSEPTTAGRPRRDLKLLLHPEEHLSREPSTIRLSWNITKATAAPDGVQKDVFFINDQFPGPTIEASSGDTLEIEVLNQVEEGIAFHWHGLHMRGANDMDGPVGFTQCAIKAGQRFTYRVPIGDQFGTFWYHAHSEVQRGDGLWGGLVVHNPAVSENVPHEYDKELLFMIGDWYHWQSEKVLASFQSRDREGNEPAPDSLLINGLGYFECSMATASAPVSCGEIEKPWLMLDKSLRYRVRLVNVGSLTGISFTVPDAEMKVFQVDGGQSVISHAASSVGVLYPAERVDFVLSWPNSAMISDTEIIIDLDNEYFMQPNFALTPTQPFLISTTSSSQQSAPKRPEIHKFNLREAKGIPLVTPLPDPDTIFMIFTAIQILERHNSIPEGFINRTTWNAAAIPLASSPRESWDAHQLVPWTGPEPVWVELTINNIDNNGHPFHLHGFDFYVLASYEGSGGWDYYNPFRTSPPRGEPFNLVDPLVKDTVYVPPYGYVVIRFRADNEGIWMLHCHVLWHAASGMAMGFQVLGDGKGGVMGGPAGKSCGA